MDKSNEFLKQFAALEMDHARNVSRIIKTYKEELSRKGPNPSVAKVTQARYIFCYFFKYFVVHSFESNNPGENTVLNSSLNQSWHNYLTETEGLMAFRLGLAEKLDIDLRKTLKHKSKDNDKANNQVIIILFLDCFKLF